MHFFSWLVILIKREGIYDLKQEALWNINFFSLQILKLKLWKIIRFLNFKKFNQALLRVFEETVA